MSNIAGKSYAMNVITPINGINYYINRVIFWVARLPFMSKSFGGLATLSLIHYARWVIIGKNQFPHFEREGQPKEDLKYNYMLFFSNFNGSWEQYVDSFHKAIPSGLDLLWHNNVKYPKSVPLQPFHSYINHNQMWTNHYYNSYPMAASNDVKAAKKVRKELQSMSTSAEKMSDDEFKKAYDDMMLRLQHCVSEMEDTPVVSLAAQAVEDRRARYKKKSDLKKSNVSPINQAMNQ